MRHLVLVVGLVAVAACDRATNVAPGSAEPPSALSPKPVVVNSLGPDSDADNLLNLAYGTAVVSRTGELNLDSSAVQAIDGITTSMWVSSPGAPDEVLVFSLLAPSRITAVGITPYAGAEVPSRVAFDGSMDGKRWKELAIVEPRNDDKRQLVSVRDADARYIRVRSLDVAKYYVRARGFHVLGGEIGPPEAPPFTGCWMINGERAHLTQDGARITGTIEADPPILLEGGTDNRVALVRWLQGATWGHAALTRTPDGAHLSGLRFYEDYDQKNIGEGWLGDRCGVTGDGPSPADDPRLPLRLLSRTGRHALYGLAFDGNERLSEELSRAALDLVAAFAAQHRVRLHTYEARFDTAAENLQHATARSNALRAALQKRGVPLERVEFVVEGQPSTGPLLRSTLQRLLASRVDIIPAP